MPIAVIGAGLIGRAHVAHALASADVVPVGIADPTDAGREFAASVNLPWFADHRALLDTLKPAAVIVATPNVTHVPIGMDCIARGLPTLMEKPIADSVEEARRLCEAASAAQVPLLVGHQRRHNPIVRKARQLVEDGVLGRPVSARSPCRVWKCGATTVRVAGTMP
jgi:predicted dehydrogenase